MSQVSFTFVLGCICFWEIKETFLDIAYGLLYKGHSSSCFLPDSQNLGGCLDHKTVGEIIPIVFQCMSSFNVSYS